MHPRYRGPAGASGSPWVLLQSTDQGSSPVDTAGFASAASFTAATGVFDVTTTAVATDVDGYREAWVRWTTPCLTAFPNFDYTRDIAEVCIVPSAFPTSGSKFGIAAALLDKDVANLATSFGIGSGVFDNANTPTIGLVTQTTTGPSIVTTVVAGTPQAFRAQFQYRRNGALIGGMTAMLGVKISGNWSWTPQIDMPGGAVASTDPTTWKLHLGVFHDGAVAAAGSRLTWKTYARSVRLGPYEP